MTDLAASPAPRANISAIVEARLDKRHRAERRFRFLGAAAITVAIGFLVILLGSLISQGHGAFVANRIALPIYVDPARIDAGDLEGANYDMLVAGALLKRLGVPDDDAGDNIVSMKDLVSGAVGYELHDRVKADPGLIGKTIEITGPVSDDADLYFKGEVDRAIAEDERKLDDAQLGWLDKLKSSGMIKAGFNSALLTNSDSTEPELAGLLGAIVGSALTLAVTGLLAVPIGVAAAVYLQEFAPKNRFTDFIEVNINNLAAVPSIVYGLLGLALFITGWASRARRPLSAALCWL